MRRRERVTGADGGKRAHFLHLFLPFLFHFLRRGECERHNFVMQLFTQGGRDRLLITLVLVSVVILAVLAPLATANPMLCMYQGRCDLCLARTPSRGMSADITECGWFKGGVCLPFPPLVCELALRTVGNQAQRVLS